MVLHHMFKYHLTSISQLNSFIVCLFFPGFAKANLGCAVPFFHTLG